MLATLALGVGLTQRSLGVLAVTLHAERAGHQHTSAFGGTAHEVMHPPILHGDDGLERWSIVASVGHVSFL
jgi:hypothetical protein